MCMQCFGTYLPYALGNTLYLSFLICKIGRNRAIYFWEIKEITHAKFLVQWRALSTPALIIQATRYYHHHHHCYLGELLSIQQRESHFLDKVTSLCKGRKAENSLLCWQNSEKFLLSLHGCLVRVRDRNVWLATNSIVLFQKEGY